MFKVNTTLTEEQYYIVINRMKREEKTKTKKKRFSAPEKEYFHKDTTLSSGIVEREWFCRDEVGNTFRDGMDTIVVCTRCNNNIVVGEHLNTKRGVMCRRCHYSAKNNNERSKRA